MAMGSNKSGDNRKNGRKRQPYLSGIQKLHHYNILLTNLVAKYNVN